MTCWKLLPTHNSHIILRNFQFVLNTDTVFRFNARWSYVTLGWSWVDLGWMILDLDDNNEIAKVLYNALVSIL
jgi:hypothetical protein